MKKLFMLCLSAIISGSVILTGCTQKTNNESGSKTTLKMLVPGYEGGYLKKELDSGILAFEKENPNTKIEIISVGWEELNSKIVQLYQAGEAPDIMLTGSRTLKQLADMGAAEDLTNYITDSFKSKRVENVLDTAKIDGKQFGIPMAFSSRALYYRSDLITTPPTTWDELLSTAIDVHTKNNISGFAIPTDLTSGTDEILNFIYQNNGRIVDEKGNFVINSKENIETVDFLKKFTKAGIPDPVSTSRSDQVTLFKNGKLAMFVSGPWEKEELDKGIEKTPYKVAVLPKGKVSAETLVTDSYVISSKSTNKEMAWKFVEFMGQQEYQRPVSEAFGWFPILKAEENDERFKSEFMKPFAESIKYGVTEPHVPNWDEFNKSFITAIQKALTNQSDSKSALDLSQIELNKK
ncbi:sugar ABC transporter substrate-binding protein [Peptostreptococcus porci]|uniref:ABC transporter substrate-binding protein n=2 Tax=Peptostreptococcus porci TaxID=2652282 RepID=UPI002A90B0AD|nr:sugar ABC transporter substrate-binding protein [Peptostreptococcus porci]MDY5437404.1 sugar ABC transporter substrate-binding protein [Peptostreptococcus porci]